MPTLRNSPIANESRLGGSPIWPKVIDFGVAKATEQPLTKNTLFTRFNQMIGTPAYMSPEQARTGGFGWVGH